MDNTETDIGDIGHTKRKTKTNKAKQTKKQTKQNKTKKKTKQNKTRKKTHNKLSTHNTTLKRCATRPPQQTRDEPKCSRTFTASYKTPSVLLI